MSELDYASENRGWYDDEDYDSRTIEEIVGVEFEIMTIENVKCPECSGEMISRTGKFGVFWGCKNYPECKGTRDSLGRSKAEREAERDSDSYKGDVDIAQGKTSFKRQRERE